MLVVPAYWVLMSVAGWKGFIQLFTKPFYWEKTEHGLVDMHDYVESAGADSIASSLREHRDGVGL